MKAWLWKARDIYPYSSQNSLAGEGTFIAVRTLTEVAFYKGSKGVTDRPTYFSEGQGHPFLTEKNTIFVCGLIMFLARAALR
jgi:hypothetical protein